MTFDNNQVILVTKDKRDPVEMRFYTKKFHSLENKFGRYEGYFPWAVMFNNGRVWLPGIFDWKEYVSGEMVTINDVPMNTLYTTNLEEGKPFALPVYRKRFIIGRRKCWEHEIEYQTVVTEPQ